MQSNQIVFSRLTDFNRLDEIHTLTHDAFVDGGLISPTQDGKLDIYSHLDSIAETAIIIAEQHGKIIASCSVTRDSDAGLQADTFFKEDADKIRKAYPNLGASWRIVTARAYRRDIRLIKKLIDHTSVAAKNLGIEYCLYCFATRHEKIYQRLIGASTITRKVIYYQKERAGNEFALMMSKIAEYQPFYQELVEKNSQLVA